MKQWMEFELEGISQMRNRQVKKIVSIVSVAAMLAGSAAQAATFSTVSGDVRINQGSGFHVASKSGTLKAGDLLMVSPGGSAQVSYSCGLTETVAPGAVYTAGDDAKRCSQQAKASTGYGPKPMLFHGTGAIAPFTVLELAAALGITVAVLCATETWICEDSQGISP